MCFDLKQIPFFCKHGASKWLTIEGPFGQHFDGLTALSPAPR